MEIPNLGGWVGHGDLTDVKSLETKRSQDADASEVPSTDMDPMGPDSSDEELAVEKFSGWCACRPLSEENITLLGSVHLRSSGYRFFQKVPGACYTWCLACR